LRGTVARQGREQREKLIDLIDGTERLGEGEVETGKDIPGNLSRSGSDWTERQTAR